jgi:uncharacterized protein YlaI
MTKHCSVCERIRLDPHGTETDYLCRECENALDIP